MSEHLEQADDAEGGKRITVRLYDSVPSEDVILRAYAELPVKRRAEWLRRLLLAGFALLHGNEVVRRAPGATPLPQQVTADAGTSTFAEPPPVHQDTQRKGPSSLRGLMGDHTS